MQGLAGEGGRRKARGQWAAGLPGRIRPRSAQARAGSATELAVLFRGDFERLMESHAHIATQIAMQLARHLGQRLRQMVVANGSLSASQ